MSATKLPERECKGCGGSGLIAKVVDFLRVVNRPCPACLGSGRVTDPTPRDAEADAETLRLARVYYWRDYQAGRVDALDYVQAGNMLAEADA